MMRQDSSPPHGTSVPPLSALRAEEEDALSSDEDIYVIPLAQHVAVPFSHPVMARPFPPPPPQRQQPQRQHQQLQRPIRYSPVHNQEIHRRVSGQALHRRSSSRSNSVNITAGRCLCCPNGSLSLWFAVRLLAFHVANCVLGAIAAVVVFLGLGASLLFLPLCGFGVVLFHVLLTMTYFFCLMDAKLHNWIAYKHQDKIQFPSDGPASERLPLLPVRDPRTRTLLSSFHRQFDAEELSMVTPRTILALVYFGSWKIVMTLVNAATLVCLVVFMTGFINGDIQVNIKFLSGRETQYSRVHSFIGILLASILLHLTGRLSQLTTRFFFCKRRA